jgi:hypothetical protein
VEGGVFRIWAEVTNREENNHWVLGPGLPADMLIDLRRGLARHADGESPRSAAPAFRPAASRR